MTSKREVERLLRERDELKALLDRAGRDLYGWNSPEDALARDRATGQVSYFSAPALRRIRELEAVPALPDEHPQEENR